MMIPFRTALMMSGVAALAMLCLSAYYFKSHQNETSVREVIKNNVVTVTHVVTAKDGTTDTTITTTDHSVLKQQEVQSVAAKPTINLSALVANDFTAIPKPLYGLSISKEFLGPITVGAFGLTNGVVGLSLGYNF